MNNIAAKLREVHWRAGWETDDGARVRRQREREEGADEIERLSAEVEKLRAALEEIDSISVHSGGDIHGIHPSFWEVAFKQAQDVARAALGKK